MLKHTLVVSKNESEAIVYVATRNSAVEKVTRVKDWAHSRHLAGRVTVNRTQLFVSARSFPPTAVAGCTGPQSTYAEEGRPAQSTSHDSDMATYVACALLR